MDLFDMFNITFWGLTLAVILFKFIRSVRLVPTQKAFVVERLGALSHENRI